MTKVNVIAFGVDGRWHSAKGEVEDKHVLVHSKKQAHAVTPSDFFTTLEPVWVDKLDDILTMEPPVPGPWDQNRAIVIEDHAVLPIMRPEPVPIEIAEAMKELAVATAEARAPGEAEQRAAQSEWQRNLITTAGFAFIVLASLILGVIALIWATTSGPLA